MTSRRDVLRAMTVGTAALSASGLVRAQTVDQPAQSTTIDMPPPITNDERSVRIQSAQRLMQAQGMAAIVLEAGTSMRYFSDLAWRQSSRLTALVIPAEGEPVVITPAFEESKLREIMVMDMEVRTWNEHESPFALIGGVIEDRGANGTIGLERTVRFFVADGLKLDVPGREVVSADSVVAALRQIKTNREIDLMKAANAITMAAYRDIYPKIETGMTGTDIGTLMREATGAYGVPPVFTLALVGEASAYPHGSKKVHTVSEGQIILMDCGCDVHGYKSDISRTWVHGEASEDQRRVWQTARRGQDIVMEMAQIGRPIGDIDLAVRRYYDSEGWGPGYKLPGLSHRTGHGIGMDVHEDQFVVQSNRTPLEAGMCFSNEPGIYLPGKFGVRTEDCVYMTEDGPELFTSHAPSIDDPMG
ncbi:MAG: Xaa-Pro peptidase family protein [Pseudomonadota bacterium]